jgi:spectinomycin phosphotransferase
MSITALTFLPLGADAASWAYRVETGDGHTYFLKLRASDGFGEASLAVPRYLHGQGVPHLVAPLPTVAQTFWVSLTGFVLALYPFVDGRAGADAGLTASQWRTFGALLKQIHACQLPSELLQVVPPESFAPSRRHVITDLEAAVEKHSFNTAAERELAAFWNRQTALIRHLVERAGTLGRKLQRAAAQQVLCHADMHPWNVLVDAGQELWLVDWDEVVLAPKERDLMFVIGGIGGDGVGPNETACFLEGYGSTAINPDALAYYRYAWAVQDIAAYGEQVFFSRDLGEDTRRAAVHGFMSLFLPEHIVALALASTAATG